MTPERWQQVESLFQSAFEREPNQRAAFLAAACAGDLSLQSEVESLLAADERAAGVIDSPVFRVAAELFMDDDARSAVGRRIGAYRIVGEINHGGMGIVYLAARADEQYEKQVALKLIKRGMDTDAILRRFRHERQILASLEHPNIARLLDGGTTEDSLPYFVMEYIEGQPIDKYCDRHKLTIIERLKLFRTVCSAVHYAHQNLVVHRDLKPSNILVTADGVPKLLNPELSAETGELTATVLRLMTPEYASPEQVRGEKITMASDIYSLGVVLYELLTGHRPYRIKSRLLHEIARVICETEPEKPSTAISRVEEVTGTDGTGRVKLTPERVSQTREGQAEKLRRQLKGDLDNIVLKALRKEPQRRYVSVEQFAEDIRRHLDGLPVIARKDTLSYRTSKFIQRNKLAVTASALFVVTGLSGAAATSWQARVAKIERAKAEALAAKSQRRFIAGRTGDYVLVADSSSLNPSDAMTVELWFTASPTGVYQFLINKFNSNNGRAGFPADDSYAVYITPAGGLMWQVETMAGGSVADNVLYADPPASILDGQFHHLAATYDSAAAEMRIYLDGRALPANLIGASHRAAGPVVGTSTELMLGGGLIESVQTYFQKGLLDEVRIYNRALSAEEVRAVYSSPASALPGLASWWRGEGDAKDSVGGNHGTLMGDATFAPGKAGQAFSFGVR